MMRAFSLGLMAVGFLIAATNAQAQPVTFDGITFPGGVSSFADVVVSYEPAFGNFGPGSTPTGPNYTNPNNALGVPNFRSNTGAVSLGRGGRIVLQFTDNVLTGSGDSSPDLHIFEIGASVENSAVEISVDGVTFIPIGTAFGPMSLDIDAALTDAGLPASTRISFVRLTDDPDQSDLTGGTVGADIDAVAAITSTPLPNSLVAAILPASRSVMIGTTATAFATIINTGSAQANGCTIAPLAALPFDFFFQTTDPATNALTGSRDTAANIAAGGFQTFLIAFTPSAPFAPTDISLRFTCGDTAPAPSIVGLNTLLLSASSTPVADIVALVATATNDGIIDVPGATGTGAFSVASVNVGASDSIFVSADTGSATLPVDLTVCQTNPSDGTCINGPAQSINVGIPTNDTPTFAVFVQGQGNVTFDPGANRIFVRFRDTAGVTRGSTSVAVRTQ